MSYWRKFLIVVLLVLSVPVQSYAAVLMNCASGPANAGQGAVSHLHLGVAEHHHEMRQVASTGGEAHHDGSRQAHACSSCVSCCVGAGLPAAAVVAVPGNTVLVAVRIPSSARVASFLTGGIERPPRQLLV